MQPVAAQQRDLRESIGKLGAAVVNAFIDMRKSLDAQLDQSVTDVRAEATVADNELREHLRYVLAGTIRNRVIGAVLLGAGILLEIAGALVGALGH